MDFNGVSYKRLVVSGILAVSLGIAEDVYNLHRVYDAEDKIEQLEKRLESFGFDAKDAIYADYEAYSRGLRSCDLICIGRVQSFRRNSKESTCVCQQQD